jgi:hypothetical protein
LKPPSKETLPLKGFDGFNQYQAMFLKPIKAECAVAIVAQNY